LSEAKLADYKGKSCAQYLSQPRHSTCAASVRHFNADVASLDNTVVLCISKDLPFAQARFCGAEGLENVETLSGFRDENFAKSYQTEIADGPLAGLESRAVVIINEEGTVIYTEQVPEIVDEPDYEAALAVLK